MTLSAEQRAIVNEAKRIQREARKAATKARPKSPKADRGRERDNGYLAFLRRQPCEARGFGICGGPIQAAHVSYRVAGIPNSFGRGVKNHDRHANPLCAKHHARQHAIGNERLFWRGVGKDAYETAAGHYAAYLAGADGPTRKALRQAANDETAQVGTPEGVKQNTTQGGGIAP